MRRVQKNLQTIPDSLQNEAAKASLKFVAAGDKNAISRAIYQGDKIEDKDGNNEQEVVLALKTLYHNKCAYCESKEFNPEIEHYRPLRRVIRTTPRHGGYYWLCYEWTNLLPACHSCNSINNGKGNKFPIILTENRQSMPIFSKKGELNLKVNQAHLSPLIDEQPYLLHPEIDEPENYFRFNNKGKMFGLDEQGRGEQTISICNLNRGNLKFNRQRIINRLVDQIENSLFIFYQLKRANELDGNDNSKANAQNNLRLNLRKIFDRLKVTTNIPQSYSLFSLYIFNNFASEVLPLLEAKKHQEIIRDAFRNYRQNRL